MSTLNIPTVELVSTLRAAGENGPLISQDYNDSWTEALADLASLAGFMNDFLIPMLDGLSTAIQPNSLNPPSGLEGRFIYGDTTNTSQLFYDSLDNESLTIAQSLQLLYGINTTTQSTIQSLQVSVTALQAQLSTTNQNDIAQALQNFAATLQSLTDQTNSNTNTIQAQLVLFQTNGTPNYVQNLFNLESGSGITVTNLSDSGTVEISTILPTFETNGTPNTVQDVLNLVAGTGITLSSDADGDVTIVAIGGSGVTLKTNGTSNTDQTLLNIAAGTNVSITNSSGTTTINAATTNDGLIHGDAIWETDSAYIVQREDFINNVSNSNNLYGDLRWASVAADSGGGIQIYQRYVPHLGVLAVNNNSTQNEYITLAQQPDDTGTPFSCTYPLLDYPNWKAVWVFGFDVGANMASTLPSNPFSMTNKSMYIGLQYNIGDFLGRPSIFMGLRYDTDTTSPSIADTTMKFEVIANTLSNSRNNTQGTTYDTTLTPTSGAWYRFEMEYTTVGSLVMTLYNGSTSVTNTFTVSPYSVTVDGSGIENGVFEIETSTYSAAVSGSVMTLADLTYITPLNGTQVCYSSTGQKMFGLTSNSNVSLDSDTGSLASYPGTIPFVTWGNNSTEATPTADSALLWDFYSFIWNPGVGGGSGTPTTDLSRYFGTN